MKLFRSLAPLALAAALLAACGGGDPYVPGSSLPTGGPTTPGSFTNIVSFGDSLSDLGTYAPATAIPGAPAGSYFGGRFTTNLNNLSTLANTGKVWVEELATSLSTATVPIVVTPAAMGFGATSQACPAATVNAALAGTCTGYSQGGARVTDPNGIGRDPVTGLGALSFVGWSVEITANALASLTGLGAAKVVGEVRVEYNQQLVDVLDLAAFIPQGLAIGHNHKLACSNAEQALALMQANGFVGGSVFYDNLGGCGL